LQGEGGIVPCAADNAGLHTVQPCARALEASIPHGEMGDALAPRLQETSNALELWQAHAPAVRALYPEAKEMNRALAAIEFEEALASLE